MIPSQIRKVLSTLSCKNVRYLLCGGQACVWYGALQFSADCDIVIAAEVANLARLSSAMDGLTAACIAVPRLEFESLRRGHVVHFRVAEPDQLPVRIDVIAAMRATGSFRELWERRYSVVEDGVPLELLSLPDLVQAKKTQRDKDWPIIRRLVEANYAENRPSPSAVHLDFWLQECRTPGILFELAANFPERLAHNLDKRPLLEFAARADESGLTHALAEEQRLESEADRAYWAPLKAELEQLRLGRRG